MISTANIEKFYEIIISSANIENRENQTLKIDNKHSKYRNLEESCEIYSSAEIRKHRKEYNESTYTKIVQIEH